jgi:hypothetical protein
MRQAWFTEPAKKELDEQSKFLNEPTQSQCLLPEMGWAAKHIPEFQY